MLDIQFQHLSTDASTKQFWKTITNLNDLLNRKISTSERPTHNKTHPLPISAHLLGRACSKCGHEKVSSPLEITLWVEIIWVENRPEPSSPSPFHDDEPPNITYISMRIQVIVLRIRMLTRLGIKWIWQCSVGSMANHRWSWKCNLYQLPAAGVPRRAFAVKPKLRSSWNCKSGQCCQKFSQEGKQKIWRQFWRMDFLLQRLL